MEACRATGVVLAGGTSRRMGVDKASLILGGQTMLQRMAAVMREVTPALMIAPGLIRGDEPPGATVVEDLYTGCGPLAGIHAALTQAVHDRIVVVTCDVPFITSSFLRELCALSHGHAITIPSGPRGPEPLIGVYTAQCREPIAAMLEAGSYQVRALLDAPGLSAKILGSQWSECMDPTGRCFFNINDRASYEKALSLMET